MAKLQITVCDKCGALDRSTKRYRLVGNERTVTVELCSEHGKPLDDIIALVPAATQTNRKHFDASITTIDEIERRKRERAKRA